MKQHPHSFVLECYNCTGLIASVSPSGLSLELAGLMLSYFHNAVHRLLTGVWVAPSSWKAFLVQGGGENLNVHSGNVEGLVFP